MDHNKIHLGIIPDGNRRWCKKNGVKALDLIQMILKMIANYQKSPETRKCFPYLKLIDRISVYILSKDNLDKRDDDTLEMVRTGLELFMHELPSNIFNIRFVGELHLLPKDMQEMCKKIERETTGNLLITCAMAYDPLKHSKRLLASCKEIDHTGQIDQIDLVVRTGGQLRSSGFLPLQTLYTEWVYLDKLFPDLKPGDINDAIAEFDKRVKNFGK